MESIFFEHREYFANRLQQIDASSKSNLQLEAESVNDPSDTTICVRIRPLSEQEIANNHIRGVVGQSGGIANIYEPKKKINGKPDLNTASFALDEVYEPRKSSQEIYDDKVEHLVQWVWDGGMSILLAYGQTGSGKTFTITALERLVIERFMDGKLAGQKGIHMCIFEVFGNSIYDLLNDRKQISILEDPFGVMHIVGVIEQNPTGVPEFLKLIDKAKSLRSTKPTTKNDHSSRSHAICRIRIVDRTPTSAPEGAFFLVDLAGSEASSDTKHHSTDRMAETKEINKSLTALKDCIRARAQWSISRGAAPKHVHIPFRTSKLTQVLKPAFDVSSSRACKTLVIACVAPSVLDLAHSRNTLRYAELLRVPVPKAKSRPYDARVPMTWSNRDVHEWVRRNSSVNPQWLAPYENGTQLCRLQQDDFVARAQRTAGVRPEQAKALYFKLWSLHVDSRALLMKGGGDGGKVGGRVNGKDERSRVKHGMFFRVSEEDIVGGVKLVMIMGPEMAVENREGHYVCAAVCEADGVDGCYELLVARQVLVQEAGLREEVKMEYDSRTRYYYLKALS